MFTSPTSRAAQFGNLLARDDRGENSIMQVISIAVSAILIVSGLVTAPGLINSARDTNAKNDIANLVKASELLIANTGKYPTDISELMNPETVGSKVVLSDGAQAVLIPGPTGINSLCFAVKSLSGTWLSRSDASTKIHSGATMESSLDNTDCSGANDDITDISAWALTGGARIEGDELVFPSSFSRATTPMIWVKPYTQTTLDLQVNIPGSGTRSYVADAYYFGSDQKTWRPNGNNKVFETITTPVTGSGVQSSRLTVDVSNQVQWLQFNIGSAVVGTRIKIADLVRLGSK